MPNHVMNKVTITGPKADRDALKALMQSVDDDGKPYCFDFNKVVPMPPELQIEDGSNTSTGEALVLHLKHNNSDELEAMLNWPWVKQKGIRTVDELVEHFRSDKDEWAKCITLGEAAIANKAKHGCRTWYDWSIKHWGTKWNAYGDPDVEEGDNELVYTFQTAWGSPEAIFHAIHQKFPKLHIHVAVSGEVDEEYEYTVPS